MVALNDINELIAKKALSTDQLIKLKEYIKLVMDDENKFYNDEILSSWFRDIRLNSTIKLTEKAIKQLEKWHTNEQGEIVHDSGEFFKISGVSVSNSSREVSGWDQPMIFQKEMGILGILRCQFGGVYHYLLIAKFEPGNIEQFQLSPTLQATYSNLKRAHGGKKPSFYEFFTDETTAQVVYKKWLCEDGGRFYLKSNLNMLIEVRPEQLPEIPADFRWFTLSQIKRFLQHDNLINPHVRGILCHI
jgi:oxidase EvaA